MAGMRQVGDAGFREEVLENPQPVLVEFYAVWCAPCRALAPILDALAAEFDGRVKFLKVDVDEAGGTAAEYGIQGVPTLMLFKAGRELKRIVGGRPRDELRRMIEESLR